MTFPLEDCSEFGNFVITFTYSTLWVDHVYPHIIDTYMTPVILTLLCELITCIPTSLTPIWHLSYLLYFVSWSHVSPHHWHLYDTCHTYSTLWVDHVYPHVIDPYMTPVILTLLCELIMCIPTSLTPIWHLSYLLYFVSWSCVSPHHWHLYDTCHTYSTLWVDHVYPHIIDTCHTYSTLWVDHLYPHIIDTYMTPAILTLLCELIMCIPTSLIPIWHLSYLLYFVSWSHVSPHHWHLYDTRHTYSTLCIPTSLTPIWHMSYLLYFVYPTSLTPIWHLSYLLYFVYLHIIDPYMTPVILTLLCELIMCIPTSLTPIILTLLCELIMCIPTSLTPIWHLSYLLYFVYPHIIDTYDTCHTLLCVSPHHWHLYDTCHTYSTLCIPTSLTPIWHLSYLFYFVYPHIIDTYITSVILTLLCVSPHHWHLYDMLSVTHFPTIILIEVLVDTTLSLIIYW